MPKYSIIANPKSGLMNPDQKYRSLVELAGLFGPDCEVHGLDTRSKEEFMACAKEVSQKTDVLVAAGGDGTMSDVYNSVEKEAVLGYVPFGSGNMLKTLLGYGSNLGKTVQQIKDADVRTLDLILCNNGKKALMASFGIDGLVLQEREALLKEGMRGQKAYAKAIMNAFSQYKRIDAQVDLDGRTIPVNELMSCIVTKVPFYGFGVRMVPKACIDDEKLHLLTINAGNGAIIAGLVAMAMKRNVLGDYSSGKEISVEVDSPTHLQIDGNIEEKSDRFGFKVLPKELKIKY